MRLLEKNKQNLKYALQVGEVPVYERDEDGNIILSLKKSVKMNTP